MKQLNKDEINQVQGASFEYASAALGGLGTGAGIGIQVGAVGGPAGMLIGGLIGAMLGTIGGAYAFFETR